jgi:hypothetical protein
VWTILAVTIGLIVGALIALSCFGLIMVLARRLRAVTERINLFLPVSGVGLPSPGTPVPPFTAIAVDGEQVSADNLAGERFFALLTTDCSSCHDQIPALRILAERSGSKPIVTIIGPPGDRARMIAEFDGTATLIEESADGPIVSAFDIHEFPTVLRMHDGSILKYHYSGRYWTNGLRLERWATSLILVLSVKYIPAGGNSGWALFA